MKRYQVAVEVTCACIIDVTAANEYDAVDEAKLRYAREDIEANPPHAADWRNAIASPAAERMTDPAPRPSTVGLHTFGSDDEAEEFADSIDREEFCVMVGSGDSRGRVSVLPWST